MAKKDMVISQVHEFMVVSPDAKGGTNELAETTLHSSLGAPETLSDVRELPDENDPYAGPRSWVVKWFGPFLTFNRCRCSRRWGCICSMSAIIRFFLVRVRV